MTSEANSLANPLPIGQTGFTLTFTFPTNSAQTSVTFNSGTWQVESSLFVVGATYTETRFDGGGSSAAIAVMEFPVDVHNLS